MTIGFSARTVMSACSLCLAGTLALTPATAAARTGPGASPSSRARAAQLPQPSLLERHGTQVRRHDGAPSVPDVSALSWLVADADSGDVLAASEAHRQLPPASTLKTLFALTVLPGLPAGLRHTVTDQELEGLGEGSSLVGIAEGLTYKVSDLWRGVFLSSGNDAVHVLAAMNGGIDATTTEMQAKARALGALDTHVVTPDGYDEPGQVSSAYDLAVFGRAGLHNADFARYCATADAWFPGYGTSTYGIQNTNRLLTGANGVEPYPGLIGVKNGYTTNAGNTLVAAARRGGRTLVVTVMNPQAGGGFTVYEEARELLDWGFAAAGHVDPVGSLDALRPRATAVRPHTLDPQAGPAGRPVAAPSSPDARGARGPQAAAEVQDAAGGGSGWPVAGAIAAAAVLGAAAVAWALRVRNGRAARG
ncbi:D-alanyl-D-alanine carboxypeptidase family protein [Streptomyces mangrovisoli]|uniref:D-alanyl-D-alanine carboxypeptidase family protein n=1 Tax=Streptomyces mangrovisoli TaxID=1428628 RepID=UPI0009A0F8C6|nr:D-alanyl-D-alanine carboxypeptidase [Streptomyces mangrovisoli]